MKEIHRLDMIQSSKLVNLIEAQFASKGLTDKEFAQFASENLGFPIADSSVTKRRDALGISSNNRLGDPLQPLINDIQRQLAADQKEFKGLTRLVLALSIRIASLEAALNLNPVSESSS